MDPEHAHATWERLMHYQRLTLQSMDQHLRQRFDLTLDHYDVLHQLTIGTPPIRMGVLADRLLVANSSCSNIVSGLVRRKLVERHADPDDGRAIAVALTAEGRRVHRRLAALHGRDITTHFTGRLTPGDLRRLDEILDRLLAEDAGSRARAANR